MGKNREEVKQYYFVIRELVAREIKRKYARSFLGIIWSVLNPLMSMAVMSMIFTTIFKRSIENFPIYYLTGFILWQFFSGATNTAMTSLVDNKTFLLKTKLPRQIFVLARSYTALTNLGYTSIAYFLMLLIFRIRPSVFLPLLVVDAFFLLLFAMGIGHMLSIAYVFFADIQYLYSIILTLWMYMSAIFYPYESTTEMMQRVILANPVFQYIYFAREIVLNRNCPGPGQWAAIILWGVGSFALGNWVFRKNENAVMQKV